MNNLTRLILIGVVIASCYWLGDSFISSLFDSSTDTDDSVQRVDVSECIIGKWEMYEMEDFYFEFRRGGYSHKWGPVGTENGDYEIMGDTLLVKPWGPDRKNKERFYEISISDDGAYCLSLNLIGDPGFGNGFYLKAR